MVINKAFNDPIIEGCQMLDEYLNNKIKNLTYYARRNNASDFHINNINSEIKVLTDVLNKIQPLEKQDLWRGIDYSVIRAYDRDKSLCGFRIEVIEKPFNNKFSFLRLDLSQANENF